MAERVDFQAVERRAATAAEEKAVQWAHISRLHKVEERKEGYPEETKEETKEEGKVEEDTAEKMAEEKEEDRGETMEESEGKGGMYTNSNKYQSSIAHSLPPKPYHM